MASGAAIAAAQSASAALTATGLGSAVHAAGSLPSAQGSARERGGRQRFEPSRLPASSPLATWYTGFEPSRYSNYGFQARGRTNQARAQLYI